jgi:hypothetical protein
MAAANKPTAVHFSLVFFVMATLILGVTTYLGFKKYYEDEAKLVAKDAELSEQRTQVTKARAESDAAKQLIGTQLSEWGTSADGANTVMNLLATTIQQQGGAQAASGVIPTIIALRTALDNAETELQQAKAALNQNQAQLAAVETGAGNRVTEFQTSQASSEQQLQAGIAAKQQAIDEKNAELDLVKKERNDAQVQKGQVLDEYARFKRVNEERISLLDKQINFYKDQLDELTKQGFDRADGQIVSVDNTTRTVWINIGSAENLHPQVSFSVYTADHRGIGRGVEDIKAKIEVTRIMEPHLAEARILDEDLFRPIAEGDPIYTPLWSAGRKEYFAIVGRPDLDDDGKSDWDLIRELIHTSGADIDLIVNDDAVREPADAKLTARTKFLIVGDIDDPAKFSGIPEKQKLAIEMQKQHDALVDEARLYGIRVVRLNDFLDYIGYKPEQRLWKPGENRPFNLQQGTPGKKVDDTFQDRSSDGTTSEIYRRNRTGQQQESDGATSEIFRNK